MRYEVVIYCIYICSIYNMIYNSLDNDSFIQKKTSKWHPYARVPPGQVFTTKRHPRCWGETFQRQMFVWFCGLEGYVSIVWVNYSDIGEARDGEKRHDFSAIITICINVLGRTSCLFYSLGNSLPFYAVFLCLISFKHFLPICTSPQFGCSPRLRRPDEGDEPPWEHRPARKRGLFVVRGAPSLLFLQTPGGHQSSKGVSHPKGYPPGN